ncbi:MAG: UDP-N-acetylmuramoyl-tripeptide--D-alanyl-D-alanine ligase [uncultured Corynebacteriales bacterium]|uniref:UDP-N-acetylmuramoyl-tripeptide--D-alanyl-D-alanine ligase n=1 Tax=uncultured Mycobacteriales bacterium TaxID=581187 RepID=A0A6J4IXL7_9ACTN|nr:MAG: UDP-N-acetylmuramoyl-tripeptide--D-alanyl-D-alanine ligase [uncultured Corynebacteriales bacterium]
MIPLSLAEVAAAVGGTLRDVPDPAARVTGDVELDSRRIGPGGLFVALAGERVDGHDHAAAAVAAGAAGVLAARPVGVPAVLVPDVRDALGALAAAVLARLPGLAVVGVTGSSGKTSTKDLLAQLLAELGPTVAPPGSFNNEIGHPYTVLRSTAATRYLVLEKSMRGIGHIAALTRIARPRIGVVLNVGSAHVGELGSRENIARAKGELVEALPADGLAVLNADDPYVRAMAARTAARVVTVGLAPDADVRATGVRLDGHGVPSYRLVTAAAEVPVTLAVHGAHQVGNSLAAAAVALELGMSPEHAAAALGRARPLSRWRMEVTERADGVLLVNDAYNANPESMAAALRALTTMARGRRSWAVLGAMAELGGTAAEEHARVGALAAELAVDRVLVVGPDARPTHEAAGPDRSAHVPDVEAAVALLRAELRPQDVVLVKASRSAGLERVVAALADPPVAAPAAGGAAR